MAGHGAMVEIKARGKTGSVRKEGKGGRVCKKGRKRR